MTIRFIKTNKSQLQCLPITMRQDNMLHKGQGCQESRQPLIYIYIYHSIELQSIVQNQRHKQINNAQTANLKVESNQTTKLPFPIPLLFLLRLRPLPFFTLFQFHKKQSKLVSRPFSTALQPLLSHFSHSLSLATHRPYSLSRHLLTHLRGAQPQIINYGKGKLNLFHHSFKSL